MGDHFIGDLTNAFRNVSVSRKRALQIIGGAMAVAVPARLPRSAEAGKHRKPPLAFVGATVTNIAPDSATSFVWQVSGVVAHPASNYTTSLATNRVIAANLPIDKVRANIVALLKNNAAAILQIRGETVPEDRIAVVLF